MSLISKIEALKRKEGSIGSDDWNEVIYNILAIIKAENEPKDKPDCEGWWWFERENSGIIPCYLSDDGIIQDFIHPLTFSLEKYLKSYKGKWIKAIVPESEG